MHPIPVVYGMTIGEYALMVNGEGWIGDKKCDLTVIPLAGYDHHMLVKLDVSPSPNLPDWQSIYLYPSVCFFEGTIISVGRGTDTPFRVIGHPAYLSGSYTFKPRSIPGVSEHPPFEGQICHGLDLSAFAENFTRNDHPFTLRWLILVQDFFKAEAGFFTPYFRNLAGNGRLSEDIISGKSEEEIRQTWEPALGQFKVLRRKYLIYP
jgi:uncharacterized protein YbbC (DUF1343 family)